MAKGNTAATPTYDKDWQQGESDADALVRAAEVVADKKRFEAAKAYIAKKQKGLDQLMDGLRRRT